MERKGLWVGAGLLLLILIVVFSFNNSSEQNITGAPVRTLDGEEVGVGIMGGNTPGCADSDGGLSYLIKGNTTNSSLTFEDYCHQNGQLVEGYCIGDVSNDSSNNNIEYSFVTCPSGYGCEYGACVVSSCTPNCSGKQCGSNGCGGSCGTCLSGQTCDNNGQCITGTSPTKVNYSTELISASDLSATIRVTNLLTGVSDIKEINEGSSSYINGLIINVVGADETVYDSSAKIRYKNMNLSVGGSSPQSVGLEFVNSIHDTNYVIELLDATDTSATLKVTSNKGVSETAEINEFEAKIIAGLTIGLNYADEAITSSGFTNEASSILLARINVEAFTLKITNSQQCTDSDGGLNYTVVGTVRGLEAPGVWDTWTDYCGGAGEEIGKLVEYTCRSDNYGQKNLYPCPSGQICDGGACVSSCTPNCEGKTCGGDGCGGICGTCSQGQFCETGTCKSFTCTDSDGGKNYNVAGSVIFNNIKYTDFCNTTIVLQEYSCTSNNLMDFNSYACPYGCENTAGGGKCKTAPSRRSRVCKTAFCRVTTSRIIYAK